MSLYERAEACYKAAAGSRKFAHLAHHALGLVYTRRSLLRDAVASYETALYFRPDHIPTVHVLGSLHIVSDDIEKGIHFYTTVVSKLQEAGIIEQAADADRDTSKAPAEGVERFKDHLIAHILRAFTVPSHTVDLQWLGRSLSTFLKRLHTLDLAAFHRGLGLKLLDTGAFAEGIAHLRQAIALSPSEYGQLMLYCTLALPVVFSGMDEIWSTRAALVRNIREALEDRVAVSHPERLFELYFLTYMLPYMGLPSHLLMKDIARLFESSELPQLDVTTPALYRTYPTALGHATGNPRYEALAPTVPVALAAARPADYDAFVWKREMEPPAAGAAQPHHRPPVVVSVGIISYQMHDCPIGHLVHRLIHALRGYASARTKAAAADPCAAAAHRGVWGGDACEYIEGPSLGGGTLPRYLRKDLSNWHWNASAGETDAGAVEALKSILAGGGTADTGSEPRQDPLASHGYVTLPGVGAFNITVFRLHRRGDSVTRWIGQAAHNVVQLPTPFDLEATRAIIAQQQLDVFIASDPGIQPEMYSLLFSRMAPVQIALWGSDKAHTLTLGLPDSVDYFVVGDGASDDKMQEQLLEQGVRLGEIGTYFTKLVPVSAEERFSAVTKHGLLDARHMYLCPQTLNGIHPLFDDAIVGILARDPAGEVLMLYEEGQELWLAKTRIRLQAHAHMTDDIFQRIRFTKEFLPSSYPERRALMSASEVVLDTFPVGIGIPALEALEVGTPVITLPSKQPLTRLTAAALQRLGVTELVATSMQDYVEKAVTLATDAAVRRRVKLTLMARRSLLEWDDRFVQSVRNTSASPTAAVQDADVQASSTAHLAAMAKQGYSDPAAGTLLDWVRFIGRAGRPWAEDRQFTAAVRAATDGMDEEDLPGSGNSGGRSGRMPPSSDGDGGAGSRRRRVTSRKRAAARAAPGNSISG